MQSSFRMVLTVLFLFSASGCTADNGGATPATLKSGVLRICISTAFPPVLSENSSGKPVGHDVTFLEGFAREQGLTVAYGKHPFDGLWLRPGRDECDIAAAGISALASRQSEGVVWSKPYFDVQRTLIIREADAGELKTMADFGGRKVGFVTGSLAETDARARAPADATLVGYDSALKGLEDVKQGKIDAFGDGSITSIYFVKTNPGLMVIDAHSLVPPEAFAFPVRKASGLVDALNEYIDRNRDQYDR